MMLEALEKFFKSLTKEIVSYFSSKWNLTFGILIWIRTWNEKCNLFFFRLLHSFVIFISAHSMDFDPFVRSTFWMVSTGLTTMWISNVGEHEIKMESINIFSYDVRPFCLTGITPECVQRFVAIPKLKDAIKVSAIGISFPKC